MKFLSLFILSLQIFFVSKTGYCSDSNKIDREFSKVSVIGLGKLGSPFAAVLASKGYSVIGVDTNSNVINQVNQGTAPVQETQLQDYFCLYHSKIEATESYEKAILNSDITFVILPTPSEKDGTFTNKYLVEALEKVGGALTKKSGYHLVVICSTVMPGSMEGEIRRTLEKFSNRSLGDTLGLCYNPEFIALGSVIKNMLAPDMVLIGQSDRRAGDLLENIHRSICENNPTYARMNFVNAEITKIAINTYVTTKISYANMLSEVCERLDNADVDIVTAAIGLDSRIGQKYLKGATAFGGPCFPRDNIAFTSLAKQLGARSDIAQATHDINAYQTQRLQTVVSTHAKNKTIAILGLSYKSGTDVVEESQGISIANRLAEEGYRVSVYDPMAMKNAKQSLHTTVQYAATVEECFQSADTILIMTAWPEFTDAITPTLLGNTQHPVTIIDCWRILPRACYAHLCNLIYLGYGEQ